MILHLVRILFVLVVLGISISLSFQAAGKSQSNFGYLAGTILAPVGVAFLMVLVDILWRRKRLQVLSGLFFGLLAGLVIAYGLTIVVNMVADIYEVGDETTVQLAKAVLGAGAVFLCVSFVLQTKDDFRFVIPYVEFAKQAKGARPMLLDTSAIIDGRIADIAETGILESDLIVPRFILGELHMVADSQDKLKRDRGRRGLDVLKQLQGSKKLDVRILETHVPGVEKVEQVDEKLVALAEHLDGRVITNDFNLNKVAQVRGVDVINVNDLANALRPVVLPGETMRVKIIRPGEEAAQGVGYLEDGTMVVVEGGRNHVGEDVEITVTSVIQTSAGRMVFGRVGDGEGPRRQGNRRG